MPWMLAAREDHGGQQRILLIGTSPGLCWSTSLASLASTTPLLASRSVVAAHMTDTIRLGVLSANSWQSGTWRMCSFQSAVKGTQPKKSK